MGNKYSIKFSRSDYISIISVVVVLIFSILTRIDSCNQNSKIETLEYQNKALLFRPSLIVLGQPQIDSFKIGPLKIELKKLDSAIELVGTLNIALSIKLINNGNSLMKFFGYIFTDTTSGGDIIRDYIMSKSFGRKNVKFDVDLYYSSKEIRANDTLYLGFSKQIEFINENQFTLHFLFLYFGENGVLYDTYYWARYSSVSPKYTWDSLYIKGRDFKLKSKPIAKKDLIKLIDQNSSWQIYDKKTSEEISEFLLRKRNENIK